MLTRYTFSELFFPVEKGLHKLTESILYDSLFDGQQKIPIWGGNREHTTVTQLVSEKAFNKDNIPTKIFSGECIILSLDGSAGYMTFKPMGERFTLNHHAGVLYPKNNSILDLRYFIHKYQLTLRSLAVSDGSGTLSMTMLETTTFDLPNIEHQKLIVQKISKIIEKKQLIDCIRSRIEAVLNRSLLYDDKKIGRIQLNKTLSYTSRNDALSEEGIYKFEKNAAKDNIKVLSGSIEGVPYGEIPRDAQNIHFLENSQGLHLVTRGKAGTLTYLKKDSYATNTNAFLLYIQDHVKSELGIKTDSDEGYYLKFLKVYLQPIFFDISSNSDVSVFPLTKVFEDMEIPKFILNEEIKQIVDKYDQLHTLLGLLTEQVAKIELLLEKEIT